MGEDLNAELGELEFRSEYKGRLKKVEGRYVLELDVDEKTCTSELGGQFVDGKCRIFLTGVGDAEKKEE